MFYDGTEAFWVVTIVLKAGTIVEKLHVVSSMSGANTIEGGTEQMAFSRIVSRWVFLKRLICYVLVIVLPSQAFLSCAGGHFLGMGRGNKYAYSYTMTAPVDSPLMIFQDDSLKIQFKIDDSSIRFQLQNLSQSEMAVQWDKVSLGVDHAYSLVRHIINLYADTARGERSVQFPPRGYIRDLVMPVDNIFFDGSKWMQTDLFQTRDGGKDEMKGTIEKNVGKSLALILPLKFGSAPKEYRFQFRIVSVKPVLWRDYRPSLPVPPPPPRQTGADLEDEITTAFIVVGLLGFAAFMISLKKQPVAE
jgi:hypothetical protein